MNAVDRLRHVMRSIAEDRPSLRTLLFAGVLLVMLALLLIVPPFETTGSLPSFGELDDEPMVRVLLTAVDLRRGVDLGPGGLRVITARSRQVLPAGTWRVATEGGRLRVGSLRVEMPARLLSAEGPGIHLRDRIYPGALDVVSRGGRVLVVNRVPMERYVAGVIMEEMGESFPDEALRAQAVCARSYAASRLDSRRGQAYDLRDDQRSQVYRGIPSAHRRAERIARESRGWILVHDGAILPTFYSSTCGGHTRSAGEAFGGTTLPPLEGVPCGACNDAPRFAWTARQSAATLARRLALHGPSLTVRALDHRPSGRLRKVILRDRQRSEEIDVTALRRAFAGRMHSTWITSIERTGDQLLARGRGFGHGVGLCQYGARTLARAGHDAPAILARYFPGATLATLYQDAAD